MKKLNTATLVMLNLCVIGVVTVALIITKSLWSFLGLCFLFYTKTDCATCPECEHHFVVDEEEEG